MNGLQVGMVRIVENHPSEMQKAPISSITYPWEEPLSSKKTVLSVEVPQEWASFLQSLLKSPSHFHWAKDFVLSNSAKFLNPGSICSSFEVPKRCPSTNDQACNKLSDWVPISAEEEDFIEEDLEMQPEQLSPEKTPPQSHLTNHGCKGRAGTKEFLVDSDLRRNNRLKTRNKGFKPSSCGKLNCLGCASKPPTLSNSAIRNIGKELCQIEPNQLSDDILMKKKEAGAVGTQKKEGKGVKSKKMKEAHKDKNVSSQNEKNED